MDHKRPRTHARAQQAGYLDPLQKERIRCPALAGCVLGVCHQRPVGHANARQLKGSAEVKSEASTPGVIMPGGVRDDHLGSGWQRPHRRLEQRALAQRQ
jgi:hypothetical protein